MSAIVKSCVSWAPHIGICMREATIVSNAKQQIADVLHLVKKFSSIDHKCKGEVVGYCESGVERRGERARATANHVTRRTRIIFDIKQ